MNPDIDPLDRALADLAATIDHDQPGDRAVAVRALARRRARRRNAGLALAGLSLVAVAALGLGRLTSGHNARTQIPANRTTSPSPSVRVGPSPTPVPPPTGSALSSSASPSAVGSTALSAAPVDWLNRTYPVACGERNGPLAFTDGRAKLTGLNLTATVSSEVIVEQDTRRVVPVEIVMIGCLEADRAYRTVLVYQQLGGHTLLGTAVGVSPPTWVFDVKIVEGRLVATALGWSPADVRGAADQLVTTTATFTASGMTVSTRAEPVTLTVRADGRVVAVGQDRQVVIPGQSVPPGQK